MIDVKPLGDRVRHGLAVAGDHRDPDAERMELLHRLGRLGPDLVLHRDGSEH